MRSELPLRDIHLPPEPSWWPPAPGWWLLAVLLIAAMSTCIVLLRRRWQEHRRRRALLAEVDHIWASHPADDSGAAIVAAWSQLLRRACLRYRPELVTREGMAWSQALGIGNAGDTAARGLAGLLVDAPYRPAFSRREAEVLREPVRQALRRLIDGHYVAVMDAGAGIGEAGHRD